jgi:hypothetical protein
LRNGNFVCFDPRGAVAGLVLLMYWDLSTLGFGTAASAGWVGGTDSDTGLEDISPVLSDEMSATD